MRRTPMNLLQTILRKEDRNKQEDPEQYKDRNYALIMAAMAAIFITDFHILCSWCKVWYTHSYRIRTP